MTDNIQAIHLFRIAQEALSNALKHGRAKSVVIALEVSDGACSLRVSDDGSWFQPFTWRTERDGTKNHALSRPNDLRKTRDSTKFPFGTVVVCTIEKGER